MSLLLFAARAFAFPVDATPLPLPEIADGIDVATLSTGPVLAVVGPGGVAFVDPITAAVTPTNAAPGRALLVRDGIAPEIVVCGNDGVLSYDTATDGPPLVLDDAPCNALARGAGGFVAVGGAALWFADDGAGGYLPADDLDLLAWGDPLVAVDGRRVAVAATGDTTLQVYDPLGSADVSLAGEAGGVAALGGAWLVGLADGSLVAIPGSARTLGDPVGRVITGDLDGDGTLDVIVSYPSSGRIGVLPGDGSAEVQVAGPWGARDLASGDVDGDGCDEVVVLDPGAPVAFVVGSPACGAPETDDLDGDGHLSGVDCDDRDAAIHPGAREICDGVDQDCDGRLDETGVWIDAPAEVFEGVSAAYTATLDGCGAGALTAIEATFRSEDGVVSTLACDAAEPDDREDTAVEPPYRLFCAAPDDGTVDVRATGLAPGPIEATASVPVHNVAPALRLADDFWYYGGLYGDWIWVQLAYGDRWETRLGADDVPADAVTFSIVGPAYAQLTADGLLTVDAWNIYAYGALPQITITDDDGGAATYTLQVSSWYNDYDTGWWYDSGDWDDTDAGWDWGNDDDDGDGDGGLSCGGCCCWLAGFALPLVWLPLRRGTGRRGWRP